ncbi:hypothetical protein R3P38DRAFT_2413723, partial [Favolaschia claudopus]
LTQKLIDAIALIQAAMPGEWKDDTSAREAYRFLSCNYMYYARFGEKGHSAPSTAAHMDHVQRSHGGRVNLTQRTPHESKEMRDNARDYAILCDAYEEVFDYIRVTLQKRFPGEYEDLSIYCDVLPMNAASASYPFGGFTLNLRAATRAHRDLGDKDICVVIPFGDFTGG